MESQPRQFERGRTVRFQPVGQTTRRLIYSLVLVTIVPMTAIVTVNFFLDETRSFHFIFTAFWTLAIVLIWRKVVVWTLGRKWLTTLVGTIPFVQVVYGQPLWNVGGWFKPDILRFGQHEIGVGLWVWVTVWVWWGWEKWNMSKKEQSVSEQSTLMSPTAKRILASIGSIPFLVGVFAMVVVALDEWTKPRPSEMTQFSLSLCLASLTAVFVWLMIWRSAVDWRPGVGTKTTAAALLLFGVPSLIPLLLIRMPLPDPWKGIILWLPTLGWGFWMAGTVRFWPMRAGYGGEAWMRKELTPRCLSCGYLLTGLCGTRCPECGDEPTIDELWHATAGTLL